MLYDLLRFLNKSSLVMVWIAGCLLLSAALLVCCEVIVRGVFNTSFGGVDEISGYAFAIAVSFGLSHVLLKKAHIRVDAMYVYFPRPLRFAADVFALLMLALFALTMVHVGASMVWDSLSFGSRSITPLRTPLAWVQLPWLFGWVFFSLNCLVLIGCALDAARLGHWREAASLIGAKSTVEQIDDEKVSP